MIECIVSQFHIHIHMHFILKKLEMELSFTTYWYVNSDLCVFRNIIKMTFHRFQYSVFHNISILKYKNLMLLTPSGMLTENWKLIHWNNLLQLPMGVTIVRLSYSTLGEVRLDTLSAGTAFSELNTGPDYWEILQENY